MHNYTQYPPDEDWHSSDIIASIKKTGTTMAALSRKSGLSSSTLSNVLYRKWPRGEKIVASHLSIPPWVIWPSRYKTEADAPGCTSNYTETHLPIP